METLKKISIGAGAVGVIVLVVLAVWFLLFRSATTITLPGGNTIKNTQSFTTSDTRAGETPLTSGDIDTSGVTADQKIFKIADGPVMAATFIQATNPTTTIVRYTKQDSGHVLDIPINVPGAIARVVSNTTIPGLNTGLWLEGGSGTLLQYLDRAAIKTVYVGFPVGALGAASSVRVNFFPDNIMDVAVAPNGRQVAYLLPTRGGVSGYIANPNGSNARRIFTLPFSQVLLSWPSMRTLLVQTKEATGVPGVAFSVSTTGTVTPLVYAESLSATANTAFSKIVYQSTEPGAATRHTYVHDVVSGADELLPFNPLPEKCMWSITASSTMYCAAPLAATPLNYLDLWHRGLTNAADSVLQFDVHTNITSLIAQPGSVQGGTQAEIDTIAISADGEYLLYITRGDRVLWGVKMRR